MKKLLILLLVLLLAVLLGWWIAKVPGVLVLQLGQKTVAAPIWLIIFSLLILILVFYIFIKILGFLIYLPWSYKTTFLNFKIKKREKLFREALSFYILKNYSKAWPKFKDLGNTGYFIPETYYLAADAARASGEMAIAMDLLAKAGRVAGVAGKDFKDSLGVAKKIREQCV